MKHLESLIRDGFTFGTVEYKKEYYRRQKGFEPRTFQGILNGEYRMHTNKITSGLIRDGYTVGTNYYRSEYNRRAQGRPEMTYEQTISGFKHPRKPHKKKTGNKWTPEYRKEYQRLYRENKKIPTMDEMLEKIKKMREQQNIIL